MKEYELLKYYPSLPSSWKNESKIVVVERGNNYSVHPSLKKVRHAILERAEVENNPEYWREIVPRVTKLIQDRQYQLNTDSEEFCHIYSSEGTATSEKITSGIFVGEIKLDVGGRNIFFGSDGYIMFGVESLEYIIKEIW